MSDGECQKAIAIPLGYAKDMACHYCGRLLREHTLDENQECSHQESKAHWAEMGPLFLDKVCHCGKKLRHHQLLGFFECNPICKGEPDPVVTTNF